MKKRAYLLLTCIVLLGLMVLTAPAAQAEPFAYITHLFSNNVEVIDTATNTVTATVPVGNVTQGAAFKFVDWSVEKGGTCFYKLEDIDLSGNAHDTRSGERFSKAHLFNAVR